MRMLSVGTLSCRPTGSDIQREYKQMREKADIDVRAKLNAYKQNNERNERTQKETGKARRRRIEQTLKQDAVASSKHCETTRQEA